MTEDSTITNDQLAESSQIERDVDNAIVEPDPEEVKCSAKETVQLGPMSATDLTCNLNQSQHEQVGHHQVARAFGVVTMVAKWDGDFE